MQFIGTVNSLGLQRVVALDLAPTQAASTVYRNC
jgi:hypothetical protein